MDRPQNYPIPILFLCASDAEMGGGNFGMDVQYGSNCVCMRMELVTFV
jgi:hypothetical protein